MSAPLGVRGSGCEVHERFQEFVEYHEKSLLEIEQLLGIPSDAMVWEAETDNVCLQFGVVCSEQKWMRRSMASILSSATLTNQVFFRVCLCFSTAVVEANALTRSALEWLLPPLTVFGEDGGDSLHQSNDDSLRCAGCLLRGHLRDLWAWKERVQELTKHIVKQLAALYSSSQKEEAYLFLSSSRLATVWKSLADMLGTVVVLEEVIKQNTCLRNGLLAIRTAVSQVITGASEDVSLTVADLDTVLQSICFNLLDGAMLESIVSQGFEDADEILVVSNQLLQSEFAEAVFVRVTKLERVAESTSAGAGYDGLVGALAMTLLHQRLFVRHPKGTMRAVEWEQAMCKRLFSLHWSVPVVFIQGVYALSPATWIAHHFPGGLKSVARVDTLKEAAEGIKRKLKHHSSQFLPTLNRLSTQCSLWMADMSSIRFAVPTEDRTHCSRAFLNEISLLLRRGLSLTLQLHHSIVLLVELHHCTGTPMSTALLEGTASGVTLLSMMQSVYHSKAGVLGATFNLVVRFLAHKMETHLCTMRDSTLRAKRSSTFSAHELLQRTAVSEALALLRRPLVSDSIVALSIALDLCLRSTNNSHGGAVQHSDALWSSFEQLQGMLNFQGDFASSVDCSFLYWHREALFPMIFRRVYENPVLVHQLPNLVASLADCWQQVKLAQHLVCPRALWDSYVAFTRNCMHQELVEPLSTDIENALRLRAHGEVLGQPFGVICPENPARDLGQLTRFRRFRFFDGWFRIAEQVENYLDAQLYNLNALMLNDWMTYAEMRDTARERYGLVVFDGYLPCGIVDQGLDVLAITEDIHVFIAHYTYNMNEQLFVQRPRRTESKHLHALHIRHMANSVRTHGTGIMSTTVNYVYKCVLQKLTIMSQFLRDGHVHSQLLRESKYVHQQLRNGDVSHGYSLSRAQAFIDEMSRLGVSDDGHTYLDRFRDLVSEIGNALGYMRMVRSGGLRAMAESSLYIPSGAPQAMHKVDSMIRHRFRGNEQGTSEVSLSESELDGNMARTGQRSNVSSGDSVPMESADLNFISQAMQNVDRAVECIAERPSEGTEYFQLLLNAMGHRLRREGRYSHLKLFHLIIPPMCVSFVGAMIQEKEQLLKKNKDAIFTDDGFALGCVFLLSLLGLQKQFVSLFWFDVVRQFYVDQLRATHEAIMAGQSESSALQTERPCIAMHTSDILNNMHLNAMMLDTLLREYVGLEETFVSCSVLFQSAQGEQNKTADESDDAENSATDTIQ